MWRDAVMLDAGDAFSDMARMDEARADNLRATAKMIVARLNEEGLDAQAIGDRDVALGRATLEALDEAAKYPLVTTNLVDVTSKKPLFERYAVIDVARGQERVKLAVFGLMSDKPAGGSLVAEGLATLPPKGALEEALKAAKAEGAEMFIVLSQLTAREEEEIAETLPEVQIFLGGDSVGMSPDPERRGAAALSFAGSQKGKHLGLLKVDLRDPAGAGAALVDPRSRQRLEEKKAAAERRLQTYERLIAKAEADAAGEAAAAEKPDPTADDRGERKRPKVPLEVYRRQLAAARAEIQLAESELGELGGAETHEGKDQKKKNTVQFELVPLSKDIADDPAVKTDVDEHRKQWPDLTPGH